jgi:acyl-CoA dehydrogenase
VRAVKGAAADHFDGGAIMSWDFETEPEFQKELDWIDKFVREEVEPLDYVLESPYDVRDPNRNKLVRPLQAEVRKHKLWACHLEPELGGQGYGQVKLALMNEILGRSRFAPTVFGCQAPDSGNGEILAKYGTPEQKKRYLEPLLANEIVSCFSMTEPQGGADPKVFTTHAELHGDNWVINGEKWFSSNAHYSSFLIAMVVTEPEAPPYKRRPGG